jgi:hypothetical protein
VTFSLPLIDKSQETANLEIVNELRRTSSGQSQTSHPRLVRQPTGPPIKRLQSNAAFSSNPLTTTAPSGFSSSSDVQTLLTYTKCLLIAAYFVFLVGSGITLNELIAFLIDPDNSVTNQNEDSKWIAGIVLLFLAAISLVGLYGALKEESCILLLYGSVILIIFVIHVVLLFHLKNACSQTQKKCYRNMATPPGLAPILVAISELAIAMSAFFMVLIIESERKSSGTNPVFNQKQVQTQQQSQPLHNISTVSESLEVNTQTA